MIINLTAANFTNVSGTYFSAPFRQDEKDTIFTISVTLGVSGNASLQCSIDEID